MIEVENLFKQLYGNNKYLIKISNKTHHHWVIYIYKNEHIQVDINTPSSLTSYKIGVTEMLKYFTEDITDVKISYNCYHDDYVEYSQEMGEILDQIKSYFMTNHKKNIIIKRKVY